MQAEAGLTQQGAGLLGALIYAGYLSAVLLLAGLRDPMRRLAVFRACLVLAVLSTAMMGLASHPWLWAVSRYLGGLSGAGGMLLAAEFILGWLRRNDARPDLGPHFMGLGLGICLSGLVVLLLGPHLGWAGLWGVFAGLAALLLPVAWTLTPQPEADAAPPAGQRKPRPAPGARRWFWLFGAGYLAAGWGYAVGATFCVDILAASGHGGGTAAAAWIILGLANAAGAMAGSVISRWFGLAPVLFGAMALQALSLAGLAAGGGIVFAYLSAILFGAAFVVVVALSLLLAGLRMPGASGQEMARMTLLYGTGQILGPLATAELAARSGSYAPAPRGDHRRHGRVTMAAAALRFETPASLPVERLLVGKPAEAAAELLPRIFSLCRASQRLAIRMALDLPVAEADRSALEQDIARDHALFLGVLLPKALGLAPHPDPLALAGEVKDFVKDCPDFEGFLTDACPVSRVLAEIIARFPAGTAVTGALPLPSAERMTASAAIENTVVAQLPPFPLLRHVSARFGRGPLWRVLARVLALSSALPAPARPRQGVAVVPASRGLYAVEAARQDGRVTRFRRWTPTGHLLAPGGILEQSLATCPPGQAQVLLALLDPCQPVALKEAHDA